MIDRNSQLGGHVRAGKIGIDQDNFGVRRGQLSRQAQRQRGAAFATVRAGNGSNFAASGRFSTQIGRQTVDPSDDLANSD